MRLKKKLAAYAASLAFAAGGTIALSASPAAADGGGFSASPAAPATGGGFWADTCEDGRACMWLANINRPNLIVWNVDGCGYHTIKDHYEWASAHGNGFDVIYADQRWDRVQPWSQRGLDPYNLVTGVDVLC